MPGVSTAAAVTPDGLRSTVVRPATEPADRDRAVLRRQLALLDDLICA